MVAKGPHLETFIHQKTPCSHVSIWRTAHHVTDFARNSALHNLQHWFNEEQLRAYRNQIKQKVLGEKRARSVMYIKDSCELRE